MSKHLFKMTPGWLFPYLVEGDRLFGTQRWGYWYDTLLGLKLLDDPIPQVLFASTPERAVVRHIAAMLALAEQRGVRHSDAFDSFVVWLLHGLGDPQFRAYDSPDAIQELRVDGNVLDLWYEQFQLGQLQQFPADYCAYFAQGGENGGYNPYTRAGFFATPMSVCRMMVEMTLGALTNDARQLSVCDPCCGTGSLLLAASNYSLNLYGQDIHPAMVRMARLNGWLYAPWMVWWPDFSPWGGPTPAQCKSALFGSEGAGMTPDPDTAPPVPTTSDIVLGKLRHTKEGQYILPLFEELMKVTRCPQKR